MKRYLVYQGFQDEFKVIAVFHNEHLAIKFRDSVKTGEGPEHMSVWITEADIKEPEDMGHDECQCAGCLVV